MLAPSYGKHHEVAKTATGGTDKSVTEKARARYVKEHFSYIRDKISSQVRYPRHGPG